MNDTDNIKIYSELANLLYPAADTLPADIEARYPDRNLPEGAKVTRFAPSPTGFVHFGSLFPTRVDERLARQSGGVFMLRIEDTDSKRYVQGAVQNLLEVYKYYQIEFDEGPTLDGGEKGDYGPYKQSDRALIYQTFAKELIRQRKAYPCFCTESELEEIRSEQEQLKLTPGYWGKWAKYRDADIETIKRKLGEKTPFVLRFRSEGNSDNKIKVTDLSKGNIEVTENDIDHVLLKSDGIPTYHFAHVIDDHLMKTTHVVRGEEWLPSLPLHLQLFAAFGFKPPKYMHISLLMKAEKKLSKRDDAASLDFYKRNGYAPESVIEYIMTLLNSNYEEWRTADPLTPFTEFPFSIKKMSQSGSQFDINKLNDISKNTVSRMTADKVYSYVTEWCGEYDPEFAGILTADKQYALDIFSIGRSGAKPRKDITVWADVKPYISLFYDKYFEITDAYPDSFDKNDIKAALTLFKETYDYGDSQQIWFDKIKAITLKLGYAADMKLYKSNPDQYKGNISDISMFIRIAVTGRQNSPDMYEVMRILGGDRVIGRIDQMILTL
jgi:glutamyl-tRNA synthetase